MTQRAVYLEPNVFRFDLQECLSPTPTVSNEVIRARTLNGKVYSSLRAALEGELGNIRKNLINGLNFIGNIATADELEESYNGSVGDYRYCISDGLYYAWNGNDWQICGDATKIADNSVTPAKVSFILGNGYPNLVRDNSVLHNALLNNSGSTDPNDIYDTLRYGIPVQPEKTYCFSIEGESVSVAKAVFKTADNITASDWNEAFGSLVSWEINIGNRITAPAGAVYLFVSIFRGDGDISRLVVQESETPRPVITSYVLSDDIAIPQCARSNLYGTTMMTLGDSLSEGGYWQEYVKQYTGLKNIVNLAVGGTKISAFADGVTEENIADVDIVFVMGLFNSVDSAPGSATDEPSHEENASVCAGYKYIVETIYSLKPSVKIVLASPHRPQADDVAEKAAAVGMVARFYGIPFIDLYNTAGFNRYTSSLYRRDAVHSSFGAGGGYEQEAKVIAGGLLKYFG